MHPTKPPPPPSNPSPLESLITHHNETFSPSSPATHLLSLLPPTTLLALRRVSHTTKSWIDPHIPSLFASLHIPFPTSDFVSRVPTALHQIAPQCRSLTVHLAPPARALLSAFRSLPEQSLLPSFPLLARLRIVVRPAATGGGDAAFEPLAALRLFLQSAFIPQLNHITLDTLSLQGILALRSGPFSSYFDADWGSGILWRRLTVLEATLVPWWRQERPHVDSAVPFETSSARRKREIKEWRSGVRILHDWVGSFAKNTRLERLRFEWVGCREGPNPLLLDEVAGGEHRGAWFSAPGIYWRACVEVWLGGVSVYLDDLMAMRARMPGLQRVFFWRGSSGVGVSGEVVVVGGREWVVVKVDMCGGKIEERVRKELVEIQEEIDTGETNGLEEGGGKAAGEAVGIMERERVDEGGDNGCEVMDDADWFSDGSMDVPLIIDESMEVPFLVEVENR